MSICIYSLFKSDAFSSRAVYSPRADTDTIGQKSIPSHTERYKCAQLGVCAIQPHDPLVLILSSSH